jgi:hypothetical protein
VALGGWWCWGRAVMWVVAPRVRSGVWLRCGGGRRRFLPSVRVRGARGRGRALVAARAAATAAHLPAVPLALSRSRLACQHTLGTGLCGCCAFTVATVTLFIPGQWTRFDSVESRLVLLIRLINHTSHPSLHLVVYHARLYISTLKSNCIK